MSKLLLWTITLLLLIAFGGGIGCGVGVGMNENTMDTPERDTNKQEKPKSTRALDMMQGSGGSDSGGGGGGGGGGHCFLSGTRVLMADGGFKDIAKLAKGDQVQSRDVDTGQLKAAAVEKIYQANQPEYFLINGVLKVTAGHPFLMQDGSEVKASELRPGIMVQGKDGPLVIQSVEKIGSESEVYNLTVTDTHTFYVSGDGKDMFWVHNK